MAKLGMYGWMRIKAGILTHKNSTAPEGKHYDLTEGNYVDNTCDEGSTWSNHSYKCEPDE